MRVLALLVLVRHLSGLARAQRRSARAFRAPAHVAKRSRFAVGRIRSARKTIAGKFPSGLHPRHAHRCGAIYRREAMTVVQDEQKLVPPERKRRGAFANTRSPSRTDVAHATPARAAGRGLLMRQYR